MGSLSGNNITLESASPGFPGEEERLNEIPASAPPHLLAMVEALGRRR